MGQLSRLSIVALVFGPCKKLRNGQFPKRSHQESVREDRFLTGIQTLKFEPVPLLRNVNTLKLVNN